MNVDLTEDITELTEAEMRARDEGRKKHSRPVQHIEVDGKKVRAEKLWGSALFPADLVQEFHRYCRDMGKRQADLMSDIIRNAMPPVFAEVEATRAEREAARTAKRLVINDTEEAEKSLQRLAAKQEQIARQMRAIQLRAKQIRAAKGEGGVDPLDDLLSERGGVFESVEDEDSMDEPVDALMDVLIDEPTPVIVAAAKPRVKAAANGKK
jgi:hypothetical protein